MPLMTYREAAQYLNLPLNTLYVRVARGDVPHIRLGPRTVRFHAEQLDRWLARCSIVAGGRVDLQQIGSLPPEGGSSGC